MEYLTMSYQEWTQFEFKDVNSIKQIDSNEVINVYPDPNSLGNHIWDVERFSLKSPDKKVVSYKWTDFTEGTQLLVLPNTSDEYVFYENLLDSDEFDEDGVFHACEEEGYCCADDDGCCSGCFPEGCGSCWFCED